MPASVDAGQRMPSSEPYTYMCGNGCIPRRFAGYRSRVSASSYKRGLHGDSLGVSYGDSFGVSHGVSYTVIHTVTLAVSHND